MLGTRHGIFVLQSPVNVDSYGCETWSLTFREEQRLKTFEKRALHEKSRPNKEKMARRWGKLRTEVLNDLYALLHQILLGLSGNTGQDGSSWTIKHAHRPVVMKREGVKPPC